MTQPFGLVLAGGRGRRLGGADKAFLTLCGRPLLAHVADRLRPQVAGLAASFNGDPARLAPFGLAALPDATPPGEGPLAGILAGLDHAAALGAAEMVSVPVDAPFLPADLVAGLRAAARAAGTGAAHAESRDGAGAPRPHWAAALWPVAAREPVRAAFGAGERRLSAVLRALGAARAAFPAGPHDPFFNINTPADRLAAERIAAELGTCGSGG